MYSNNYKILSKDFIEDFCCRYPTHVLKTLLADRSAGRNIIWADNEYEALGEGYMGDDEITVEKITGLASGVIKPRIAKETERQSKRTKSRAEVFTPSWLCNQMNNDIDEVWFGRRDVFNVETTGDDGAKGWAATDEPVEFPKTKEHGWHAYVEATRLEITCGEAPFVCSRYDTVTGRALPVAERIGFLDRKLRVVSENAKTRATWTKWALVALRSCYGYEYQGDNLLIARINVFETYMEHLKARWNEAATAEDLEQVALVVSWNFWQMNGFTDAVPTNKMDAVAESTLGKQSALFKEPQPEQIQLSMFDLLGEPEPEAVEEPLQVSVPLCVLYDWINGEPYEFASLKGGSGIMTSEQSRAEQSRAEQSRSRRFYAVIGNPPYQEAVEGTSDKPIYNYFMDESYKVAKKVELVTPGRYLFNAGKTPKDWNRKMLDDPHLKVVDYRQKSEEVFPNTDIKGGVAVTYRDENVNFGAIEVFSAYAELRSIQRKIAPHLVNGCLSDVMYLQNRFNLKTLYEDYPEAKDIISSDGKERRIVTSAFNKLSVFEEQGDEDSVCILGLVGINKRVYKWIKRKYIEDNGNLSHYKVVLPKSNGSGAIGEVLSTPLIGEPLIGYTQSFIGIGSFDCMETAEAALKYVKSKFARAMLGILKITQDNPPEKWKFVPLQNFTADSDIDWSKSIPEIDQQLYAKYGLDESEIEFIETHVKEMN